MCILMWVCVKGVFKLGDERAREVGRGEKGLPDGMGR